MNAALFVSYYDYLLAFARKLTRNRSDADDLLHDTFERAMRHSATFRGGSSKSWLGRVMLSVFWDGKRRTRLRGEVAPMTHFDDDDEVAKQAFEIPVPCRGSGVCVVADMHRLLMEVLTQDQADAIEMNALGYEYSDIADLQRVEVGTVKSRINRGRAHLASLLEGRT